MSRMNRFAAVLALAAGMAAPAAWSNPDDKPAGWAGIEGAVTGGAGGTVTEVASMADLQRLAKAPGKAVIYVKGKLGDGQSRVEIASDKTIFGLPGAVISGGIDIRKGTANVILRNLKVEGPGAVDVDGVDCIGLQGCRRIWLDHLDVSDGQDGNLDITNEADLVTVSWCKFTYTSKSKDHQFTTLIGSSDSKTADRGKLRVTLHHNWWAEGVKERMPRVRFGKVHVANNLFNSSVASHCVRAGFEADILVEGNAFLGVGKPIDLFENNFTAITQRNNLFVGTSGNTEGKGTAFTPPYTLALDAASAIEAKVKGSPGAPGAGATLGDPRSGTTALGRPEARGPVRAARLGLLEAWAGGKAHRPGLWLGRQGLSIQPR